MTFGETIRMVTTALEAVEIDGRSFRVERNNLSPRLVRLVFEETANGQEDTLHALFFIRSYEGIFFVMCLKRNRHEKNFLWTHTPLSAPDDWWGVLGADEIDALAKDAVHLSDAKLGTH